MVAVAVSSPPPPLLRLPTHAPSFMSPLPLPRIRPLRLGRRHLSSLAAVAAAVRQDSATWTQAPLTLVAPASPDASLFHVSIDVSATPVPGRPRSFALAPLPGLRPIPRLPWPHRPGTLLSFPSQEPDPNTRAPAAPRAAAPSSSHSPPDPKPLGRLLRPHPCRLHRLLEPYTKDQLIAFLLDVTAADPDLLARIHAVADSDVSHRKIFVHGLGWDATRETLLQAFEPYGPIEDCNVVVDKVTGRAKGYGFVLFRSRAGAVRALKQPQKKIKNRVASCQLASIGPVPAAGGAADTAGRKIHVSNVHADATPDKLKVFFARFGEIEAGPIGFDMLTGKSRGFALFVYKTQEGARRALEEPYKMFEGHQLHCQLATDSQKGKAPALAPSSALLGPASQPVLAAVAAAQNLALLGQNPAYGALLSQNPLLAAAALNPAAAAALNPGAAAALNTAAAGLIASQGQALGGGVGVEWEEQLLLCSGPMGLR